MNIEKPMNAEFSVILSQWISSCTRSGKVSRNTIAIGIVVLDHLRRNSPVYRASVISNGGEIKGARSGLRFVLEKYGLPKDYLKEVTTRQAHQDGQRLFEAFRWGLYFESLSEAEKDLALLELVKTLTITADEWLKRQNLKLEFDRRQSPTTWVNLILENAKNRSGGIVEQHLIGAKLERVFPKIDVPNHPAHAADRQTERDGDFTLLETVYHVTASPSRSVIQKCVVNIRAGLNPILLVPAALEYRAKTFAEEAHIEKQLTILSIEAFVAVNIIEKAAKDNKDFFAILKEIIEIYNRRLTEVETDLSLKIEIQ